MLRPPVFQHKESFLQEPPAGEFAPGRRDQAPVMMPPSIVSDVPVTQPDSPEAR
jgi:hypothetical protein